MLAKGGCCCPVVCVEGILNDAQLCSDLPIPVLFVGPSAVTLLGRLIHGLCSRGEWKHKAPHLPAQPFVISKPQRLPLTGIDQRRRVGGSLHWAEFFLLLIMGLRRTYRPT